MSEELIAFDIKAARLAPERVRHTDYSDWRMHSLSPWDDDGAVRIIWNWSADLDEYTYYGPAMIERVLRLAPSPAPEPVAEAGWIATEGRRPNLPSSTPIHIRYSDGDEWTDQNYYAEKLVGWESSITHYRLAAPSAGQQSAHSCVDNWDLSCDWCSVCHFTGEQNAGGSAVAGGGSQPVDCEPVLSGRSRPEFGSVSRSADNPGHPVPVESPAPPLQSTQSARALIAMRRYVRGRGPKPEGKKVTLPALMFDVFKEWE